VNLKTAVETIQTEEKRREKTGKVRCGVMSSDFMNVHFESLKEMGQRNYLKK
jgi:hypothetical protein